MSLGFEFAQRLVTFDKERTFTRGRTTEEQNCKCEINCALTSALGTMVACVPKVQDSHDMT